MGGVNGGHAMRRGQLLTSKTRYLQLFMLESLSSRAFSHHNLSKLLALISLFFEASQANTTLTQQSCVFSSISLSPLQMLNTLPLDTNSILLMQPRLSGKSYSSVLNIENGRRRGHKERPQDGRHEEGSGLNGDVVTNGLHEKRCGCHVVMNIIINKWERSTWRRELNQTFQTSRQGF